jgi:hypothetical protein
MGARPRPGRDVRSCIGARLFGGRRDRGEPSAVSGCFALPLARKAEAASHGVEPNHYEASLAHIENEVIRVKADDEMLSLPRFPVSAAIHLLTIFLPR